MTRALSPPGCARLLARTAIAMVLATAPLAGLAVEEEGKRLFIGGATPACALCHALKDAGAQGSVGPSLDEIKPDAARVVTALKNGIGQMPAFTQLSDAQIQALARYVAEASRR